MDRNAWIYFGEGHVVATADLAFDDFGDKPYPSVGDVIVARLTNIVDPDGKPSLVTFTWEIDGETVPKDTVSYDSVSKSWSSDLTVPNTAIGKTYTVGVTWSDGAFNPENSVDKITSPKVRGFVPGQDSPGITRIEPSIRGVTVSAGDTVTLGVNIYGRQDVKDQSLGDNAVFQWSEDDTGISNAIDSEIEYTAPSSPGNYDVVASLGVDYCQPVVGDRELEDARENDCQATFEIRVRRPSTAPDDGVAPANPPGEIPTILTDGDGNQYEVFTPEGGGTFTGEGYTLSAGAGAVPNGEYIGVRVSDEGSASNAGMTHQRYTLGGNMYSVSAVDASNADITSYALNSAATVCVPLPDELRSNISKLAMVAINADGSLTILSASVRLGSNGTQVCGNLSGLPTSVAVGSSGAPAPLPTPVPPTATPEAPDTGGAAPTSNAALWALLLGFAVVAFSTFLVIGRRRESSRK